MTNPIDASQLGLERATLHVEFVDEHATAHFAAALADAFPAGVVYLVGGLGAGKTTLTRAWLHAKGHQGSVKSPTYTLVEPYEVNDQQIYHFDLYRLDDPFELELMGIRDYVENENALLLIEWPQKGEPVIPHADLSLVLTVADDEMTRRLSLSAGTPRGLAALQDLKEKSKALQIKQNHSLDRHEDSYHD